MFKIFKNIIYKITLSAFIVFSTISNSYSFDLNKMLNKLAKPNSGSTSPSSTNVNSRSGQSADKKSGSSVSGFVCAGFKEKTSTVLYKSLDGAALSSDQNGVASDLNMKTDDAKRLLQDQFINTKGAGWVTHPKAEYASSFLNRNVKATFIDYEQKPEMRLEMAARLRKAANDPSMKKSVKGEALFAYSLILARFERFHGNSALIDELLNAAFKAGNVGASYVKALRMYKGYGVEKNVNAAANFSALAVRRVDEINEEAERLNTTKLKWQAPSDLQLLNLTDPEFKGHKRYRNLAAQGEQMRRSLEAESKSNRLPALRREAELLARHFNRATNELVEIYGLAGQVATEKHKFQVMKARADANQQVLETVIAIDKETTNLIENAIQTAGSNGLDAAAQVKAKKIRSQFDLLAFRSVFLMLGAPMSISEDYAFAMKTADRMRTDGCLFVSAMDDYFKRSDVRFTAEEAKQGANDAEALFADIEKANQR